MNVLFLPRGTERTASSRYRVYAIVPHLRERGFATTVLDKGDYFLDEQGLGRVAGSIEYVSRVSYHLYTSDVVFVQKFIPPTPIRLLLKRSPAKVVYDFDDPIFAAPRGEEHGNREGLLAMFDVADTVTAGSESLKEYADQYHSNVQLLPPSVSEDRYPYPPASAERSGKTVIGWIGNPQNLRYLDRIQDALRELLDSNPDVELAVVSSESYEIPGYADRIRFYEWSQGTEIDDLCDFDIAVRPLGTDEYSRKKGGLVSVVQCMALGIPVVATPVECSHEVIDDGSTGLFASSQDEWVEQLQRLVDSPTLRATIGRKARDTVERNYFREQRADEYAAILRETASI